MSRPAPTGRELAVHPLVAAEIDRAWAESMPDDAKLRREEGGWVYMDVTNGEVHVHRAAPGWQAEISLNRPPEFDNCVIVAIFHTHPNPVSEGWQEGPSESDVDFANAAGVPSLIKSFDAIHLTGPSSRRGDLIGNPGFPDPL